MKQTEKWDDAIRRIKKNGILPEEIADMLINYKQFFSGFYIDNCIDFLHPNRKEIEDYIRNLE